MVYLADYAELMHHVPAASVDAVFADLHYRLSNGGVTVTCGPLVSVDKGTWNRSLGLGENHRLDLQYSKRVPMHPKIQSRVVSIF